MLVDQKSEGGWGPVSFFSDQELILEEVVGMGGNYHFSGVQARQQLKTIWGEGVS